MHFFWFIELTDLLAQSFNQMLLFRKVNVGAAENQKHWIEGEIFVASFQESGWRRVLRQNVAQFQANCRVANSENSTDKQTQTKQNDAEFGGGIRDERNVIVAEKSAK